jgi:alkylation response protein AidB-like acyl-CoA dehydrogenase
MEFDFSAAQQHWYDAAVRFAREELADPESTAREERGEFWREGYERCGRLGIQGLPVPREYGGLGVDLPTTVAALEGLGFGCADAGLVFTIAAAMFTVTLPILSFGTDAQKERFLPGLAAGRLVGGNAATEPGAGSDIFAMETRAERRGDRWILNGRKAWITSAPTADLFVCFATTDPSKGVLGITAFLVERGTAGLRTVREVSTLGLRTAPLGEIVLEDCGVPADNLLGREGRGSSIFNAALQWERGALLAGAVGTMRRQLEECIAQARSRKQFGQPIGRFQSVSNRIVDMTVRLETSRLMVYRYAWAELQGQDAALWASMAKLHVSECFVQNSLDAVRLFGAAGYSRGNNQERDLRDSVASVIFSGTNDIQRNLIAQQLRLG